MKNENEKYETDPQKLHFSSIEVIQQFFFRTTKNILMHAFLLLKLT